MHKNSLNIENSVLVIIDIQEKFMNVIYDAQKVIENSKKLIKAASILDIPVIITEHYPKGLGHTVNELFIVANKQTVLEKTTFSCYKDPEFASHLKHLKRKQVIITGIEAHVCVNQTVLDLLTDNYQPHLIADAISSRCQDNAEIALEKMINAGAIVSSVELALFELLKDAKHPNFKEIQKLIL